MKPTLLGIPAIRTEDGFPGEGCGARQGVEVDHQAIAYAVELDGLSHRRVDYARVPKDGRAMSAYVLEFVEGPDLWAGLKTRAESGDHQAQGCAGKDVGGSHRSMMHPWRQEGTQRQARESEDQSLGD
jgi:hypothetical protein